MAALQLQKSVNSLIWSWSANRSPDGSVDTATCYRLDGREITARDFSFLHSVQTGYRTNPASYPMGTRDSFPEDKAAGTSN
jgi:hypothetical protein